MLQFDDIAGAEFVRRGGGVLAASQKTFDLAVRARDGGGSAIEHVFRGIAKQEWAGLFEFLKAKGIRIDNLRDAAAGAGAGGGRALDLGGSRGGDGGGGGDDDDSGEDEEFEAGSESDESSDEESDSADEDDDDESGGDEGGKKSKSKKEKEKEEKRKKRPSTSPGSGTPAAKKKKRKQAPREAGAPKKPMAAYMHFSNAKRAEVLAANPAMTFGEVGKATGELWRSLDADGKKPWEALAAKDKARFAEEEAAWQEGKKRAESGEGGGGGEQAEEKEGE